MSEKRFFRFAYPLRAEEDERGLLLRDGDAFCELAPALHAKGYTYGGLLVNRPQKNGGQDGLVDTSDLTADDLLVLTTRPPLDDDEEDRKVVERSDNSLERTLFLSLRKCFKVCARPMIKLTPETAARLPEEFADRAEIQFLQYGGATYRRCRRSGKRHWRVARNKNLTALYLLYVQHAWKNGPALLTAFGVGGLESQLWAYLLRTKYQKLLELKRSRFVMAELETEEMNMKDGDLTLSFVETWKTRILVNAKVRIS